MHAANTPSAVRTHAPSPLEEIPPDVLPLVVRHISLREGRSITSLACVSLLFAQWMAPHRKAVQLYRELLDANGSTPANVRSRCTSTLRHLAEVSEACSLELFLAVSTALQQRFPGPSIGEHIVPLLEHIRHLLQADQPAALLGLMETHGDDVLYATQPHYLQMAACIGALQPSATQARLAETLGRHITTG